MSGLTLDFLEILGRSGEPVSNRHKSLLFFLLLSSYSQQFIGPYYCSELWSKVGWCPIRRWSWRMSLPCWSALVCKQTILMIYYHPARSGEGRYQGRQSAVAPISLIWRAISSSTRPLLATIVALSAPSLITYLLAICWFYCQDIFHLIGVILHLVLF